jgi:hypothetical protein
MRTIEFRDGERDVPEHVALLLAGLKTATMTYDQAVRASEKKLVADKLNGLQADAVARHFRR